MSYPPPYLEFIRLFNEHQFFEAHEVLELFWRKETGPDRQFYQGLIQLAAIFVHLEKRNRAGAERLFQTASAYLEPYGPVYHGLDLNTLMGAVQQVMENDGLYLQKKLILAFPSEKC